MDARTIKQWQAFCLGTLDKPPEDFSSVFREVYLEPMTDEVKAKMRQIFQPIPNGSAALEKMLRLDEAAPCPTDAEIIRLVKADLSAMRPLGMPDAVLAAFDLPVQVTTDEDQFREVCHCRTNSAFYHAITDYSVRQLIGQSRPVKVLCEAFYGVAHNPRLQCALQVDLVPGEISFENYFELYFLGADYALGATGAVAMNYRGG